MRFRGKIQGGHIVPVDHLDLPEGTDVDVNVELTQPIHQAETPSQTVGEFLMQFAGIMDGTDLPKDGARNHDHYIYGSPKRES